MNSDFTVNASEQCRTLRSIHIIQVSSKQGRRLLVQVPIEKQGVLVSLCVGEPVLGQLVAGLNEKHEGYVYEREKGRKRKTKANYRFRQDTMDMYHWVRFSAVRFFLQLFFFLSNIQKATRHQVMQPLNSQ